MEPNKIICNAVLAERWVRLAQKNGIGAFVENNVLILKDQGQTYEVPIRQDEQGASSFLIQRVTDESLRTRIELMTLASGGNCPVGLSAVEFNFVFRCPEGFCNKWPTLLSPAEIVITRKWAGEGALGAADGIVSNVSATAKFLTGIAVDPGVDDFCEFVALAPRHTFLSRDRLEQFTNQQQGIISDLGGELLPVIKGDGGD